jgi:hypothetical protein
MPLHQIEQKVMQATASRKNLVENINVTKQNAIIKHSPAFRQNT